MRQLVVWSLVYHKYCPAVRAYGSVHVACYCGLESEAGFQCNKERGGLASIVGSVAVVGLFWSLASSQQEPRATLMSRRISDQLE
jgi:hypothetical protein